MGKGRVQLPGRVSAFGTRPACVRYAQEEAPVASVGLCDMLSVMLMLRRPFILAAAAVAIATLNAPALTGAVGARRRAVSASSWRRLRDLDVDPSETAGACTPPGPGIAPTRGPGLPRQAPAAVAKNRIWRLPVTFGVGAVAGPEQAGRPPIAGWRGPGRCCFWRHLDKWRRAGCCCCQFPVSNDSLTRLRRLSRGPYSPGG